MTSDATPITPSTWLIHCDGTALPNPGMVGIGVVLLSPTGTTFTLSQALGVRGCNNEAEAAALIAALRLAQQHGARALHIRSDSAVVIEQTSGTTRTKIARLAKPFAEARELLATFDLIDFQLVPRRQNAQADALARASLGLAPKPTTKKSKPKR
jgi:ribonuclease HI